MVFFYKREIALLISSVFPSLGKDLSIKDITCLISEVPENELGDYSFPCFHIAKKLQRSPRDIARDFVLNCSDNIHFARIQDVGPYINFSLERKAFVHSVLKWSFELEESAFKSFGADRTVVIDFSSPNIAKPFSVAHLRSTSIGNSLCKIFTFLGYKTISINHIGDWGTSFGNLISAYLRWGKDTYLEEEPIKKLLELYVRFHREAKSDSTLEYEGKLYFKELEEGKNSSIVEIWDRFRTLSLDEFKRIYKMLNVSFDYYLGESFYKDKVNSLLDKIEDKGLSKESEGALVIPLEGHGMLPFLLRKQDSATLYGTRDLAAAIYRKKEFDFDNMFYVVGSEQSLYFKQLFKVLDIMGCNWAYSCEHIKFGLMHFKDGKMSTREGKIIFLEDLIGEACKKAIEKIEQNEKEKEEQDRLSLEDKNTLALKIGVSAVIFFDLKNTREKDCIFDWDEVLNPKGETGIYLQYAHARLCGILRNFEVKVGSLPRECLPITEESAFDIALVLALFEEKLLYSAKVREPSIISRFLIDLAKRFSSFYKKHKVVDPAREALSYERVTSVIAVRRILAYGMGLLGIEPLERI